MNKNSLILAALSCGVVVLAPASQAGSLSTTVPVLAVVESACTVIAASQLNFGDYTASNLAGTPVDSTMTIEATCTAGASFRLSVDDGLHPVALGCPATPSRRMAALVAGSSPGTPGAVVEPEAPDTRLPYGIFTDSSFNNQIGCHDTNGLFFPDIGSAAFILHGRIFPGANVIPAAYHDFVTVTIDF